MPLSCALGLTACLMYGGGHYTAKDALEILDNCGTVMQLPATSYAGSGMGVVVGEAIERRGLKLDWPSNPAARKGEWARSCAQFQRAFSTKTMWQNLEKWPN